MAQVSAAPLEADVQAVLNPPQQQEPQPAIQPTGSSTSRSAGRSTRYSTSRSTRPSTRRSTGRSTSRSARVGMSSIFCSKFVTRRLVLTTGCGVDVAKICSKLCFTSVLPLVFSFWGFSLKFVTYCCSLQTLFFFLYRFLFVFLLYANFFSSRFCVTFCTWLGSYYDFQFRGHL